MPLHENTRIISRVSINPMSLKVPSHVAALVPYVPGKPVEELERELGIAKAIKLASNENPLGPSERACSVLNGNLSQLHRYPDGSGHALRSALAGRCQVAPDQVILGNGSDEIISLLARAFLAPQDEAVMASPTFIIYKMAVEGVQGKVIEVPLREGTHDLQAMARAVTSRTRLLFICNPNNPTGTMVSSEEVESFIFSIPEHVIVVFDEAYYEYVRSPAFPKSLRYLESGRHVITLRTFSKIYGLAGLRIGYGLTSLEIAGYLNQVRPPFNTNSLAQRAALAALEDEEHVRRSRELNAVEMEKMEKDLVNLGYHVFPSQANFLYIDLKQDGRFVFEQLLKKGIIVRHIEGTMIRVTIGLPDENSQFLNALREVCVSKY